MRLVALKRLRYPRGPEGKEYFKGDEFTALTERDATALRMVKAVKDAPGRPPRKSNDKPPVKTQVVQTNTRAMTATNTETPLPVSGAPGAPVETVVGNQTASEGETGTSGQTAGDATPGRGRYNRTDIRPEE